MVWYCNKCVRFFFRFSLIVINSLSYTIRSIAQVVDLVNEMSSIGLSPSASCVRCAVHACTEAGKQDPAREFEVQTPTVSGSGLAGWPSFSRLWFLPYVRMHLGFYNVKSFGVIR